MVRKKITEVVSSDDPKSRRWKSLFAAGRMAYETGKLREAETLLARAMELAKEIPQKAFAINATAIGTAAILLAEKRSVEAESRLRKSIAGLENSSESELKELLAVALRFHAQALLDAGDEREAERELKRSAAILADLGADASVQMAYTLCDLSGLYLVLGRISEATENIFDALQILSVVLGTDSPEYTRANMIYKLCLPMDSSAMLDAAGDGIMQMEYFYDYKHPNIARALSRYLKVLTERGDTVRLEEAKQRFQLASAKQ